MIFKYSVVLPVKYLSQTFDQHPGVKGGVYAQQQLAAGFGKK